MHKLIIAIFFLNGLLIASDVNQSSSNVVGAASSNAGSRLVIGGEDVMIRIGDHEKLAIGWVLSCMQGGKGPNFVFRNQDGEFTDFGSAFPAHLMQLVLGGNWVFCPKDSGMYTSSSSRAEDVFVLGTRDPKNCLALHFMCQRRLLANSKIQ